MLVLLKREERKIFEGLKEAEDPWRVYANTHLNTELMMKGLGRQNGRGTEVGRDSKYGNI